MSDKISDKTAGYRQSDSLLKKPNIDQDLGTINSFDILIGGNSQIHSVISSTNGAEEIARNKKVNEEIGKNTGIVQPPIDDFNPNIGNDLGSVNDKNPHPHTKSSNGDKEAERLKMINAVTSKDNNIKQPPITDFNPNIGNDLSDENIFQPALNDISSNKDSNLSIENIFQPNIKNITSNKDSNISDDNISQISKTINKGTDLKSIDMNSEKPINKGNDLNDIPMSTIARNTTNTTLKQLFENPTTSNNKDIDLGSVEGKTKEIKPQPKEEKINLSEQLKNRRNIGVDLGNVYSKH